jgi:hypothetical protein
MPTRALLILRDSVSQEMSNTIVNHGLKMHESYPQNPQNTTRYKKQQCTNTQQIFHALKPQNSRLDMPSSKHHGCSVWSLAHQKVCRQTYHKKQTRTKHATSSPCNPAHDRDSSAPQPYRSCCMICKMPMQNTAEKAVRS